MAEPQTILGAASSVVSIVDVLGKIITITPKLRSEWQDADLAVLIFELQLTALKTALNEIKEWIDTDFEDTREQLMMNFDCCMPCCRLLIGKINAEISQFQTTSDDRLDSTTKSKLLFKTNSIADIQKMILLQTNALNLLLAACYNKTPLEQKGLLAKPQTRELFKNMEDDSTSMIDHRDVDSLLSYTYALISSSKKSLVFGFDRELFVSRIYERWIRGSFWKNLREKQRAFRLTGEKKRSLAIDHDLEEYAKESRRELRIMVNGSRSRAGIVKACKITCSTGYSADELLEHRPTIFRNIIDDARALADMILDHKINLETEADRTYVEFLAGYRPECGEIISDLDPRFGEALSSVWRDPYILPLMERRAETHLIKFREYFLDQLQRISSPDYFPNEMDVIHAKPADPIGFRTRETRFEIDQLNIRMYDLGKDSRKHWINRLDNVRAIMLIFDIDEYDQYFSEDENVTWLQDSLTLFDSVVNSRFFVKTRFILLLNKVDIFKSKLARSPLKNHFPDYSGGDDVDEAAKYILSRFSELNRANRHLYPHFVKSSDLLHDRFVSTAIKDIFVQTVLEDFGII